MTSIVISSDLLNQLQADLMQVLSSCGDKQTFLQLVASRLAGESTAPEVKERICLALAELTQLLACKNYLPPVITASRAIGTPSSHAWRDRKPYRVLVGRVRTAEGYKLVGDVALLNNKDAERLIARRIVEAAEVDTEAAALSEGAYNAMHHDAEQRQAALANFIEQLQCADQLIGGPTAPREHEVTIDVRVDDPDAATKHLKEMPGSSDASIKGADGEKTKPELLDPEQRLAAIAAAVPLLDLADETHWLRSGAPDVKALEGVLGYHVTAAERDAAWERYQAFVSAQQGGE